MQNTISYKIKLETSEHPKRGVAFLISEDRRVTAKTVFDELPINIERFFRHRFDAWKGGMINKRWYHSWDMSEFGGKYTHCFVFIHQEDRFYGFLCNPKESDRSYQVCILVNYAEKYQHKTDETNLKSVEELRNTPTVLKVISNYFKECENENALDRTKH
jgi:hypothetical protein